MSDEGHKLAYMVQRNQLGQEAFDKLGIIGQSLEMRALRALLPRIATSSSPLLVRGESGTGKDLIARAVHALSPRNDRRFVAVNCAAIPETLVQSELFGHVRGAFTSAHRRKLGKFELADKGTILLDEIGDLSVEMQATLLHVLETRSVDIVGGDTVDVDVRIVTATHVDLEKAVREGRFREDLYYRLNVLSIEAPPLRERGTDIQLLADYFFNKYTTDTSRRRLGGFSADARLAMQQWPWKGNVRELLNRVKKTIVMCEQGPITREDLGLERRAYARRATTLAEARCAAEIRAILTALDLSAGNISVAANTLGVSRMTLYRLMKKHKIDSDIVGALVDAEA